MLRLSFIAIICLCWLIPSKANDIRDLQIEGMSVGDSLLDYFDKEFIVKNKADVYDYIETQKFFMSGFYNERDNLDFSDYDGIQVHYKSNDQRYIIYGISGKIFRNYHKNINACYLKQDEILQNLKSVFKDLDKSSYYTLSHPADKSGKSKVRIIDLLLEDSKGKSTGTLSIECYYWHKDTNYISNLKVVINDMELNRWLK